MSINFLLRRKKKEGRRWKKSCFLRKEEEKEGESNFPSPSKAQKFCPPPKKRGQELEMEEERDEKESGLAKAACIYTYSSGLCVVTNCMYESGT